MPARTEEAVAIQLDAASRACLRQATQLTNLRRAVLSLILQAERPLTAYQLLDRLKPTRKSAAPPTIYRALEFLLENRLIHKVERLNAFVACTEADHGHGHAHAVQFLICQLCGNVQEMEDHSVAKALDAASRRHGFQPAAAIVEVEGVCADCRAPA
jgi:Fur family zinc uptake transcriptional regulator